MFGTLRYMSPLLTYILLTSFLIMAASLSGIVFAWKTIGDWLKPRLHIMIALAMGVFMVIVYGLVAEVMHTNITLTTLFAFLLGGILLEIVTTLLPKGSHVHHHGSCEHTATAIDARRVLVGDALHNIHDGLVLVPAFLVSPVVGFGTAAGVLLHEIVQEIAEFFILRGAGYSTKKALVLNFAVSSTILIGVALSWFLVSTFQIGNMLIAMSAGGFSYIIVRDIAPSIMKEARKTKRYLPYILAICAGALIMLAITFIVPTHEEYEDEYPLPEGFGLATTVTNLVLG